MAMKYLNSESGRSMVEMLGTLAIIGVLSIGGITAYSYAMDRWRANETINELTVRAMGLMSQVNRGEIVELNMEMGNTTKFGYPVDAWIGEVNTDYFYISLEQVPPAVCRHMLKIHWETPTAVYVGDYEYYGNNEYICGEDTYAPPMDFEFYRNFEQGTEYFEASYYETSSYSDVVSTNPGQGVCEDASTPLGDVWGSCHACDYEYGVQVGTDGQCNELCTNRTLNSEGYCVLPCPSDKPLMNASGSCYTCDTSSYIYVGSNGQCSEVCSDRIKTEGDYCSLACPTDKPLMDKYGNCNACDYSYNITVGIDGQCSEVCSNRIKEGEICRLACGEGDYADKPLTSENGKCYACDYETDVYVGKGKVCYEACPNRYEDGGYCKLACGQNEYGDTPRVASHGACYSCDTTENVNVGTNGKCTEICANRELISNGVCALSKQCGVGEYADKPLQGTNGTCYACDTTEKVYVSTRGKCEIVCQNRKLLSNGYCIFACSDNDDCGDGKYCSDMNTSDSQANPYMCSSLNFNDYTITYTDTSGTSRTDTFYVSNNYMSWWDAYSACNALGKKLGKNLSMITASEFVTETDGSAWNGIPGVKSSTSLSTQLYSLSRKPYIWTSNLYNDNYAFDVLLYSTTGTYNVRRTSYKGHAAGGIYAVCQ
ncbi:MAG: hypothetical protein J6V11_01595 [Alphaproteobacteria bacterium]|nr:hypothetical protein [Alphaproteobacteria bacterium]